jgi:hypothetical protein
MTSVWCTPPQAALDPIEAVSATTERNSRMTVCGEHIK